VISSIKVADDQKGFIVRGYEVTGQDAPVKLNFPLAITQAIETHLIEEDLPQKFDASAGEVQFEVSHHSIIALRLKGEWNP
jgi:alpha-mannosidase